MRQIIFILFFITLGTAKANYQIYGDFNRSSEVRLSPEADLQGSQSKQTFGVNYAFPSSPWGFSSEVYLTQQDLSKFYVLELNDNYVIDRVPLKNDSRGLNLDAALSLTRQQSSNRQQVSFRVPLESAGVSYGEEVSIKNAWIFAQGLYELGLEFKFNRKHLPNTFYRRRHEASPIKESPSYQFIRSYSVWWEAALTERLKAGTNLILADSGDFRPLTIGAELKSKYALNERLFLSWTLGQMRDQRNQAPQDDRGYLHLAWSEVGASFEPVYGLLVSTSYAYILEREKVAPNSGTDSTLSSDQYGFALSYQDLSSVSLKASFWRGSTGEWQQMIGGSFQWSV